MDWVSQEIKKVMRLRWQSSIYGIRSGQRW